MNSILRIADIWAKGLLIKRFIIIIIHVQLEELLMIWWWFVVELKNLTGRISRNRLVKGIVIQKMNFTQLYVKCFNNFICLAHCIEFNIDKWNIVDRFEYILRNSKIKSIPNWNEKLSNGYACPKKNVSTMTASLCLPWRKKRLPLVCRWFFGWSNDWNSVTFTASTWVFVY